MDAETLLLHAGKRIAVKVEERMGNGLDWYASTFEPGVRLSHDNETLYSRFCGLVIDFIDSLAALRREDVIRPVREAVAYMQEHYMDSDMSLDTVASVVGLSAPYFSGLFKRNVADKGSRTRWYRSASTVQRISSARRTVPLRMLPTPSDTPM